MPSMIAVEAEPITPQLVPSVAAFLHEAMDSPIAAQDWATTIMPTWPTDQPNHGFLLRTNDRIVGVYLAFYSTREIAGRSERFCNLAAWCVLPAYRAHGIKLLRAMVKQDGYHLTDLSPSGNVIALNRRLGFVDLDVRTALRPNLPLPSGRGGIRAVTEPSQIEALLEYDELQLYRHHAAAAAAKHVVMTTGDKHCYVIFRHDRRKRLRIFASILFISDPSVFGVVHRRFFSHLLLRHGVIFSLCEVRLLGFTPRPSIMLKNPRPKMFRSATLIPDQIDYLYSELTCVSW